MTQFHPLFYPRGVAVAGSMSEGKLGFELVRQIVNGGFQNIYIVNPKAQGLFEAPAFKTVAEIGSPVDVIVIASPPPTVSGLLKESAAVGITAAVIITSGFGEIGNQEGENEIREIVRQYGIRVIGPNCAGIVNTAAGLFATLEVRPPQGAMAFISQSGALGGAVLAWAEEQGVGISKFVSYGNRADLDEIDLLPYLAGDPETKVAALYIESVRDGSKFIKAIRDFCAQKPLVVIKSGRTEAGQRAALSHTGSLAGTDKVYDAVLRDCGALRVETVEEMFDLCKGFASLPPVRGRKIVIVTNSGGPGILSADRAESEGLQISPPDLRLRENLRTLLPPTCGLNNPIDLTVQGTEDQFNKVLTLMLGVYDAALAINVATPYLDSLSLARGVAGAAQKTGKPVVSTFMSGELVAPSVSLLKKQGVPNFPIGERAVTVLARMAAYEEAMAKRMIPQPETPSPRCLPIEGKREFLEPQAMAWLKTCGIPVPEFIFATTEDEAIKAGQMLGFPVVLKIVSPNILHKSDWGGVILSVGTPESSRSAFRRLEKIGQGNDFRGVMVYPMFSKAQEVILGCSFDKQFGPVVLLGLGGIFTEIFRDVVLKIPPLCLEQSQEMIRQLKGFPILAGSRGQKPCDLPALAQLIMTFSRLPIEYPEISEIDLNPVFVFEKGVLVGDIRVILKEPNNK